MSRARQIAFATAAVALLLARVGRGDEGSPPTTQPAATTQPATSLRVVTFNVAGGQKASAERIAAGIARHRPDVVFLQEARPALAAKIAAALKLKQAPRPDSAEARAAGGALETAVLCREPLRNVRVLRLDFRTKIWPIFGVTAEADLAGRTVTLVSVHLRSTHPGEVAWMAATAAQRHAQADLLVETLAKTAGPIVVAGDFNEGSASPFFAALRERLAEAFERAGRGSPVTFPGFAGGVKIDHVFCTPTRLAAVACFVDPARLSDHRMVVATLRFIHPEDDNGRNGHDVP